VLTNNLPAFRHLIQHEEAKQQFRRVLDLGPHHSEANLGLGYCLQSLGDHEGLLEAFRATARATAASKRPLVSKIVAQAISRCRDAFMVLPPFPPCRSYPVCGSTPTLLLDAVPFSAPAWPPRAMVARVQRLTPAKHIPPGF
jgi:hypothetical protein